MEIVDKDAMYKAPSSKFLRKEEYSHIYDQNKTEHLPMRKNYIFKYNVPLIIDDNEGEILLKKYISLKKVNEVNVNDVVLNSLYETPYNDLKNKAVELGYKYRETMVKKDLLIAMIMKKETPNAQN